MASEEVKINIKKCVNRLIRRVNKAIYYNDKCVVSLAGAEIHILNDILTALYIAYLENKDNEKYIGMGVMELEDKSGHSRPSLKGNLFMMIPQFIHVLGRGKGLKKYRFYSLNENGIRLVERLRSTEENV